MKRGHKLLVMFKDMLQQAGVNAQKRALIVGKLAESCNPDYDGSVSMFIINTIPSKEWDSFWNKTSKQWSHYLNKNYFTEEQKKWI